MAQRPSRARQKLQLQMPLQGGHSHSWGRTHTHTHQSGLNTSSIAVGSHRWCNRVVGVSPGSAGRLGPPPRSGSSGRARRTGPSPPHTLGCGSWFWCRWSSGGTGGRCFPEGNKRRSESLVNDTKMNDFKTADLKSHLRTFSH